MAKIICDPAIYFHGDLQLLAEYVEKAAACSVDLFKLQLFHPNRLASAKWKEKRKFYERNFISDSTLQLIRNLTEDYGMQFVATVNDTEAVKRCASHKVSNIKIASGQIIEPMINAISEHKWKRIFVSTGMLYDNILYGSLEMIMWLGEYCDELIVMHCVSLYPTEYSEMKLNRIYALQDYFGDNYNGNNLVVGYSDHGYDTVGCLLAIGMGCSYIEKHFKISGSFGPTVEVAADEEEMAELCAIAHQQTKILGKRDMKMCPRESESIEHYQNRYLV